ncbi:MAG: hypothetical protein IJI80_07115 [Methanobrevibacter sp.]|uniref:hypothetical protein n=1 Tax=Methanobrevibacter sp. TaxID=66852 RepID=UPI0025F47C68|nr:hypothetical protein [Methanobrevibacter sp.]MBQ6139426.1 hypothetical protein [Methanobrevibacter sp.]
MSLLQNFMGIFKKQDELDLAKDFKREYEANNLENMKSIVDKFVDHYHDSYYASCSMVIYIILLYKEDPFKVPPNRLNNLSIMERNIKFFDTLGTDSLDKEELELRQWYRTEVQKNVKLMESEGLRFSSE